MGLGDIIQLWTILLPLGSLQRSYEYYNQLFCCFVDLRKDFDMVPRKNLWIRLEEINIPLQLRAVAIRMYEKVISMLKNTKGWSKEINCNIGVN
jgi:hypothetical protein